MWASDYDIECGRTEADEQRVRECSGEYGHLGDYTYPEGVYFCAGCGAQFDDPEHGIDLDFP